MMFNMKISSVIFDMDGTICDTSEGIFNSIRYAEKKMGLRSASIEQMKTHLGPSIIDSYSKNYNLTGKDLELAVSLHKEYSLAKGLYESSVYGYVPDLMRFLKEKGIKITVATLKLDDVAKKIIQHHKLDRYVDYVFGALPNKKVTKEELIKKCIDATGCNRSETIMIGDSNQDYEGAKKNGIAFIAALYGYGYRHKTETKEDCLFCAETVFDMIDYFKTSSE